MKKYLIGYDKNKIQTVIFFDIQDFEAQDIRGMSVLTFSEDNIDYTYTGTNGVDFKEVSKAAPDFYFYEVVDEAECKKRGISTNPNPAPSTKSTSKAKSKSKAKSTGTPIININSGIPVTLKSGKVVNILDPNDMSNLTQSEVKEIEKELKKQLSSGSAIGSALGQILGGPTRYGKKVAIDVDFSKDKDNPTITFPDGRQYTFEELNDMDEYDLEELCEDNKIDVTDLMNEIDMSIWQGITGKTKLNVAKLRTTSSTSSGSYSGGCGGGSWGGGCGSGSSYSGGGCGGSSHSGC